MKKRYLRVMTVIIALACLGVSACGSNPESVSVAEKEQDIDSMNVSVDTDDIDLSVSKTEIEEEPAVNVMSDDESIDEDKEKASEYWYIDTRFRDAVGHEFYFLNPDEKGNPTKITLSGFSDEINNGTFDFRSEPNTMSPAETPNDPWIIGSIIGPGDLIKKDELSDDQFRFIGVDIWFVEDTAKSDS